MLRVAVVVDAPFPLIQAGASAVIVVALQSPESGGRILDALVGAGGVALFVAEMLKC